MGKIKKLYLELSSKDYGKLHYLGWMLLSSLIVSVIILEILSVMGFGENLEFSDFVYMLTVLSIAPLFALGISIGRLIIKALSCVLVFMENFIIKGIIYIIVILSMTSYFGAVLSDSTFLPESEILQYVFIIILDVAYIVATVFLLKCKKIKPTQDDIVSSFENNNRI